jgi:hypothetical protein
MKSRKNTSLSPQEALMIRYVQRDPIARAAIDCWRFRPGNLLVKMTKSQLTTLSERVYVTFHGE